ncbi:uncharacterized protein [Rutidosis leptorrhynchoides]|uniref:uncharacterized protein n=1 Tax=Rutidosis leptorrhynchoides TaxID=125765 RepID=UPI003A992D90
MAYFQGHPILVLTYQPLKQILRRPESSGRLAKWAIELGKYEINFAPRNAVKGQVLAEFILETNEKVDYDNKMALQQHVWELHTDGASSEEGTGAGLKFDNLEVVQIPQNKKKKADVLSKLATLTFDHLHKRVLVEELKEKSIHEKPIMAIVESAKETWMTPYLRYLHDGGLPIDKAEARRIRVTAPMYEVDNGVLYRKSYNGPLLRCLTNDEALKVVKEMHEGPSLYRDVAEIIKRCENCQRHGTVQRLPKYDLIPVSSAWPFCKWAIDIVGPFNRSTAKALAKITGENVKKFVWHDIVCRYGVPNEIFSDNGKQFAENPFRSWCEELGIKQNFTSVAHPQANGQVEVTNKEIVAGIKARLGLSQTGWVDELPNVLWAHRTTPKWSTGETPFSIVYGTEAVIPAEICVPTQRIMTFDIEANSEALRENLNLLEERRLMAAIR